jgi:hypothetical protein
VDHLAQIFRWWKNRGKQGENGRLSLNYIELIRTLAPDFFCMKMLKAFGKPKDIGHFMKS